MLANSIRKMKKAQGLPVQTLIIVIIALVVLALVLLFYGFITGKHIFPDLAEKVKTILGLWNASQVPA